MKRFVDIPASESKNVKRKYRAGMKIYERLLDMAEAELAEAGRCHFELESIYKLYMNFDVLGDFSRKLCEKMFSRI